MREIKFRGKRLENGEWVYGYLVNAGIGKKIDYRIVEDIGNVFDYEDLWNYKFDQKTIGQYTGLKDKNGIEIYQGDILQYFNPCNEKHNIGIVKWEPQFAGFSLFKDDNDKYAHESDWLKIQELTIIGNIHDNPTEDEE